MSSNSLRITLLIVASCLCTAVAAQITDPIPDAISPGSVTVRITDWIQVPDSGSPSEPARINLAYHSRDGSDRLFVNDQRGFLYVIENDSIALYLHLNGTLTNALPIGTYGNGFNSFTFHPQFATNGKFYTVHMEDLNTGTPDLVQTESTDVAVHSIVTEWIADDPSASVFSGTHREMLRIEEPRFAHTIQLVSFNPNAIPGDSDFGHLYIGQGDGGALLTNRPQSLDSPHGSILRIDPDGNDGANGRYGIPPDNPFATDMDASTLGEIWAYGFRNPHRFSWDTEGSGKMLIGDIGQTNIEEINLGIIGENYGWNQREGSFVFDTADPNVVNALPVDDALLGYKYPVAQYDHDEGNAVAAGFVYRGSAVPDLDGLYLFGDIVNGRIFYTQEADLIDGQQATIHELNLIDENDVAVTLLDVVQANRADLRFGLTEAGEIVILTKADGMVRRLEMVAPTDSDSDGIPDDLDNCQLVANVSQLDTDGDGFGNICDADLNNDNVVNFFDVSIFIPLFLGTDEDADFDGNGQVNFFDYFILTNSFLQPPGP